jgi:acetylornithine deacetylase/succinyl-diaminopimelate desuccinylase-like protein
MDVHGRAIYGTRPYRTWHEGDDLRFTQSKDGLSHNAAEYTSPEDLEDGANILLHTMLTLAETNFS